MNKVTSNFFKIVLQWHTTGESPPNKSATIGSPADLLTVGGGGMTVPIQRGSMAVLPSRSRFMITDILGGGGGNVGAGIHTHDRGENGRSPSPQSPRDLSATGKNNHHMHHLHHNTLNLARHHNHMSNHHRHDDSDSDDSGPLDDNSSNGKLISFHP